jgi:response regulator RpfG family c-di-GMP phosphodiesterase
VCFLTAISDLRDYEQYKKEAYPKLNERHFVAKPISNDEIIRRVNEMLTNNSNCRESLDSTILLALSICESPP